MQYQASTLVELFEHNAKFHADSPAVIFEDCSYSHHDLYQAIKVQAAALFSAGVRAGDRVLVLAGNRPEVIVLLGAAAWIGAMLVPINLRLAPAEVVEQARDSAPALVVVDESCAALWRSAWPDGVSEFKETVLSAPDQGCLTCVSSTDRPVVPRDDSPESAVLMLYTAAVEGHARGAVLAQSHLLASAYQTGGVWDLGERDRWLGVLPLFHAAGIGLALALLAAGGGCVLLPKFDPAASVTAVSKYQVTVCATFAPMLGSILDAVDAFGEPQLLSSLRICMGLEPPLVIQRLSSVCPSSSFWTAYGQAEVSNMICLGLQSKKPGSAGRPVPPTLVRIQDESGIPLPPGTEGEIAVSGPTVFLGYWEAASQKPYRPGDTWHRTGDIGWMDEDGWLWFVGRAAHKQLIKTGGENVYPAEVEQLMLMHPAVGAVRVFGLPDEQWGEAVHAECVLKAGAGLTETELLDFLENKIARYKRPKTIKFLARALV